MRKTDIAIVGAGLSGSLAATMLGRAGHAVTLIDPFESCRPDFRCEKLEEPHIAALSEAGVLDQVLPAAHRYFGIWVARLGRLAEFKPVSEYGIGYSALVNRLRTLVPPEVTYLNSKVSEIARTPDRQTLTLVNGDQISARLVVGATGAMADLVGERRMISRCHSVSIGFDVEAPEWSQHALTYFGEAPEHRIAYLTVFPLGSGLRANLFVYRSLQDEWLRKLRDDPQATIAASLPGLSRILGPLRVRGPLKLRPVDLVATDHGREPGIALIGDAFATACPVSGTGASKALIDAERLCNAYVPAWLASPGMGHEKIAQYYDDPVKRRSDAHSLRVSMFAKRAALGEGALWNGVRWSYYAGSRGRHFLKHGISAPPLQMAG